MLKKLRIHDRSVMIYHVGGAAVWAQNDIGWIADQRAIQSLRTDERPADDGVCGILVCGPQGGFEVDRINARIAAAGHQCE